MQIPTNATGTPKINICATNFNAGVRSPYISPDGNTRIAANIRSSKHNPSKILSTTSVASVPPNLIPLAQAKYLARTISPSRIGKTLLDIYPIIITRNTSGKAGVPSERNKKRQRTDRNTMEIKYTIKAGINKT